MKFILIIAIALIATTVHAEETAPVVVAEGWWVALLATLLGVLGTWITYGVTKMFAAIGEWFKDKKDTEEEAKIRKDAIEALHVGVEAAQIELVRQFKDAAADGKLTKEEIAKIQKFAYDHALSVAKGPALELLKTWGFTYAKGWLSRIVDGKMDTDTK